MEKTRAKSAIETSYAISSDGMSEMLSQKGSQSIYLETKKHSITKTYVMDTDLSSTVSSAVLTVFDPNIHSQTTSDLLLINERNHFQAGNAYNFTEINTNFPSNSFKHELESTDGNTFVDKVKDVFHFFQNRVIKPIINKFAETSPADSALQIQNLNTMVYDLSATFDEPNIRSSENFFDCDDYLFSEDTIDFVVDSTKISHHSFGDEFPLDSHSKHPTTKDPTTVFYDCINKPAQIEMPSPQKPKLDFKAELEVDIELSESQLDQAKLQTHTVSETPEILQYLDETTPPPMDRFKHLPPNRNAFRRKRRGKRHTKVNYRKRGSGSTKNRHQKIRQEVKMIIHEDIEDCSITKDLSDPEENEEPETDLEIIDTPKSQSNNTSITSIKSTNDSAKIVHCVETPAASPEIILSGCIFTQFFRFDNANGRQRSKSLPLRFVRKFVPHMKQMEEQPIIPRRMTDSENDDSFIVFEDYSPNTWISIDDVMAHPTNQNRQRQPSECSDDFIQFADDTDDGTHHYCDTTDEDFTDSTDDSDNSEDSEDSDANDDSDDSDDSDDNNDSDDGKLLQFFSNLFLIQRKKQITRQK